MGWSVKGGGLGSHTELDNIGTKTHARIDTDLAALVMAADPRGKLPTVWVSATTARIPAGSIFFDADTGSAITFAADRDAVITVSGVGGLDASDTEANSTWYYLQAIWKDDGTYGAILSSSSGALGTAPTGYVNRAKLHAVYNDSGGDIDEFTAIPQGPRGGGTKKSVHFLAPTTPATSPTGLGVSGVSGPAPPGGAAGVCYPRLRGGTKNPFFPSGASPAGGSLHDG